MAQKDGQGIRVVLDKSRVVFEGTVRSIAESAEAERAAWNIPGVIEVENRLKVAV
jgi:osmotically-inducible protein OsmY